MKPTVLYVDNSAAKTLIDGFKHGLNVAHLVMRLNFLHEQVTQKVIQLTWTSTENNTCNYDLNL